MTNDVETSQTTDTPRPGTTHPHLARERALKVLFAADVRQVDPRVLLDEVATHPKDLELLDELEPDQEQVAGDEDLQVELTRRQRLPLDDYTRTLVRGVASHRRSIDALLEDVADRWPVHRMPAVDRNLLRMAVYELAEQDTPHAVVIDEGVALAIAFAGEKARSFVNGVLETVRKRVVAGEVELELAPEPPAEEESETAEGSTSALGDGDAHGDAEPDADREEHVEEEELTTDALDEVDEAASAAYDLALDLLDAEGPLEETPGGEDVEAADESDDGWTTDLARGDADVPSLDELDYLDDLEQLRVGDDGDDQPDTDDDAADADTSGLRDEDDALW